MLWAFAQRDLLQQPFDLLIATSMVDLSSLRGFVPALARIPTLVYFHENQFAYPASAQRADNVEPQLVPLYAALCADRIAFNSNYNRTSFLQGARSLFRKLPDAIPAAVLARLEVSSVLPVPMPESSTSEYSKPEYSKPECSKSESSKPESSKSVSATSKTTRPEILEVVWNHRWEYDKGIDLLLELCKQVHALRLALRLHIVGEQFRQRPMEFQQIDELLTDHAALLRLDRGRFGYVPDREEYEALLRHCDVVLSTAHHDFQGLAIQEACMLGCTPLAPARLVYPEYLENAFLYRQAATNQATAVTVVERLQQWQIIRASGMPLPKADLTSYRAAVVRPQYAALFEELLAMRKT